MRSTSFTSRVALVSISVALALFAAHASSQTAVTAPVNNVVGSEIPSASIMPSVIALGLVLLVIVGLGWVLRRLGPGTSANGLPLRSLAQFSVGPKERIVALEFQDEVLLLGVTAQQINLLTKVPRSSVAATPLPSSYAATDLMARWLKTGGRTNNDVNAQK
jgi:flagellar protein FliO/FliZ